jgi:SAM-dependent methyltransferase
MNLPDCHLDLGCGEHPRNPYDRKQLYGVDIRAPEGPVSYEHRVANLVLEPIPFADSSLGSVSAFDYLEHVPRLFPDGRGGTVFPFVRLMDEIWRVLAPGGRLYALTPAYPHPEAFVDPTHVNIITDQSHTYFCGESPLGRMYGFSGRFEVIRVLRTERASAYSAIAGSPQNHGPAKRAARHLRRWIRFLRGKRGSLSPAWLLWELEAVKP